MSINVVDRYDIDMSGQTDNSVKLAKLQTDMAVLHATNKPMPKLVFPEGICAFDKWPNLAFDNLQIVADGECILQHTGNGDAVTFDGSTVNGPFAGGGINALTFTGFTINPSMNGGNGLVITACHRSLVSAWVNINSAPTALYSAIAANFLVLTEIRPVVKGGAFNVIGLTMDAYQENQWCSTACRITMPVLESCQYGTFVKCAGYINYHDGSIEGCDTGIEVDVGGNNHFVTVEMEGNHTYDIVTTGNAHDNTFYECGDGSPSKLKTSMSGWNNRLLHGALEGLFGL